MTSRFVRDAVREGWLCDVRAVRIQTTTNLDPVHTRFGDFVASSLRGAINTPARNRLIVNAWLRCAQARSAVVFCADIQHSQDVAACFRAAGVAAEAVWGSDPERERKLAANRNGEVRVLTNCAVLTEGYDDWRIACVVIARPTTSQPLFAQMVGRGLRLEEGVNNLRDAEAQGRPTSKRDCLVMDVVDSTKRHTLITLPSIFGLPLNTDLARHSVRQALGAEHHQNGPAVMSASQPFDGVEMDLLQLGTALPDAATTAPLPETLRTANDEPATGAQLMLLRGLGVRLWRDFTRFEAMYLIDTEVERQLALPRMLHSLQSIDLASVTPARPGTTEPATAAQLLVLKKYRVTPPPGLTKAQATDLINDTAEKIMMRGLG